MVLEEQMAHEAKERARWARLNLAAGQFLDRIERDTEQGDFADLEAVIRRVGMEPMRRGEAARS